MPRRRPQPRGAHAALARLRGDDAGAVDVQVKGPYTLWEHTHTFEADGDGAVIVGDRVRYALPLGPLGQLGLIAHRLFVRSDVERIFDYRREAVAARLASAP